MHLACGVQLPCRCGQLEELLTEQQTEHENLEKQMSMELTMAEKALADAQAAAEQQRAAHRQALADAQAAAEQQGAAHKQALEELQAAHEQALAAAREQVTADSGEGGSEDTSAELQAAQEQVKQLEAKVGGACSASGLVLQFGNMVW